MTERQMQFRVGLFVILAVLCASVMVFHFGKLKSLWEPRYPLLVHFDAAPGVHAGTPVRRNGIAIGKVEEVVFDNYQGGVIMMLRIKSDVKLRQDAKPTLVRSLLGDATLEFTPGTSPRFLEAGAKVEGKAPQEPMELVEELEQNVSASLVAFNATNAEWQKVAQNLNGLMMTNRGQLDDVIERTAISLDEFTRTMNAAHKTLAHADLVLGDPQTQKNLQETLAALPQMVNETRQVIQTVKLAVSKADANLTNLASVTEPLALRSTSIVTRLDSTVANLDELSGELRDFVAVTLKDEGSLQQLAANPELYRNLNNSAASLSLLLKNLEPIMRDVRIFSDKIARHPELMGVGGALSPSSGVKDPAAEYQNTTRPRTNFSRN